MSSHLPDILFTGGDAHTYVDPTMLECIGPVSSGSRVLDLGCGGGRMARQLADQGATVVGIDPNADRISAARREHPGIRFEQRGVSSDIIAELDEAQFDLVISTEVLEHLYAPEELTVGAFGALRPGGRLVLSTPYHGYLKNVAIAVAGKMPEHYQPLYTGGHIKFFDRQSLSRLLIDTGFVDLRFRGCGRIPGLWKSMVVSAVRPA